MLLEQECRTIGGPNQGRRPQRPLRSRPRPHGSLRL